MEKSLGDDNIVEKGATDSQIDKQAKKCPDDDYREESQLCGTCITGNGTLIHNKFTSILGQMTVKLPRSMKARCLIIKHIGVCRWESIWVKMILPKLATIVIV